MICELQSEEFPDILLVNTNYQSVTDFIERRFKKREQYIVMSAIKDIAKFVDEIRNKPMLGDAWYYSGPASEDLLKALKRGGPFPHCKIFLTFTFKERWLMKKYELNEHENFGVLDCGFVRYNDKKFYASSFAERKDFPNWLFDELVNRSSDVDSYKSYIETMNYYPGEITQQIFEAIVPDSNDTTINDLARAILTCKKKKTLQLLDKYSHVEPKYILPKLRRYFDNLLYAKTLLLQGVLPSDILKLQISHAGVDTEHPFFKLAPRRMNMFLYQAETISIAQLFYIQERLQSVKFADKLTLEFIVIGCKNHLNPDVVQFCRNDRNVFSRF